MENTVTTLQHTSNQALKPRYKSTKQVTSLQQASLHYRNSRAMWDQTPSRQRWRSRLYPSQLQLVPYAIRRSRMDARLSWLGYKPPRLIHLATATPPIHA